MSSQTTNQLYQIQIARQLDAKVMPKAETRVETLKQWYVECGYEITLNYARHVLFDQSHAEDVVNDAYCRVHQRVWEGLFEDQQKPFSAYVKQVVRYVIYEIGHASRRIIEDDSPLDFLVGDDPYHEIEINDVVTRAVQTLVGNERKVIYESFFNHRTVQEIALLLNLSINNVSKIKGRALEHLRASL